MGESRSLLPTSCPVTPASSLSSSGSPPLDLASARRRGSGGCGEARIGDPAFDPAPVDEDAALASFPSLTCDSHCSRRASSLHCFSFADDRFPLFFFTSHAEADAGDVAAAAA